MRKSSPQAIRAPDLLMREMIVEEIRLTERRELARDLHDTVIQPLAALVASFESLHCQSVAINTVEISLSAWQELAREAMQSLRATLDTLSTAPRPHPHAHLGLLQALRRYVAPQMRSAGISLTLEQQNWPSHLPLVLISDLYLTVREALVNIQQHAHATEVTVQLQGDGEYLCLTMSDNGIGFSEQNAPKDMSAHYGQELPLQRTRITQPSNTGHGLGISGMRRRVERLNGVFEYTSQPGKGVRIQIRVPFLHHVHPAPAVREPNPEVEHTYKSSSSPMKATRRSPNLRLVGSSK